jgi:hypothetical protein
MSKPSQSDSALITRRDGQPFRPARNLFTNEGHAPARSGHAKVTCVSILDCSARIPGDVRTGDCIPSGWLRADRRALGGNFPRGAECRGGRSLSIFSDMSCRTKVTESARLTNDTESGKEVDSTSESLKSATHNPLPLSILFHWNFSIRPLPSFHFHPFRGGGNGKSGRTGGRFEAGPSAV